MQAPVRRCAHRDAIQAITANGTITQKVDVLLAVLKMRPPTEAALSLTVS